VKLSIITVNKNNAAGLEKTMQSVVAQTYTNFEYIVIDGGSDDGSVEIIKKYVDKVTYWVSEADSGIYNGMNKGIKQARGDFCLFLNSGDWLVEAETLRDVFAEIAGLAEADVYYSDLMKADGSLLCYVKDIGVNNLIYGTISHQNSLIKRSLFIEHGYYNESLSIASDWEFFLRECYAHKIKFRYINTNIAIFNLDGISTNKSKDRKIEDERVLQNVFGDLSDSIIELWRYQNTSYADIIMRWGDSAILEFALRTYRFIVKRIIKQRRKRGSGIVADERFGNFPRIEKNNRACKENL
jgi:glycosyltransferase involved in cell wall biosynthesis